jgi:hypothetical protein
LLSLRRWKNDPVTDWTTIATSGATALGTLVLAGATFAAVRSGQRAARATEMALLAGVRPVLVPSRLEDTTQKVRFVDDHWVHLEGGRAVLEATKETIYLVVAVRNVGNGIAVLDRWDLMIDDVPEERSVADLAGFRRLTRDIYVPAGDQGFWQGAIRQESDPLFEMARDAIDARRSIAIDILYGDHEGGQRTVSRFLLSPTESGSWLVSVARHWNMDRPDPR